MASKALILNLAKLLIATAWADGRLQAAEVNVLKDLIYSWGDISEEDWLVLEAYMDNPVGKGEGQELLSAVIDSISSKSEKQLVIETLTRLVEADGKVTEEESRALDRIRDAVEAKSTGLGSLLGAFMGNAVQRRSENLRQLTLREERIEDFLQNAIYFQLVGEMQRLGMEPSIRDDDLRKLCLAAGLLAQVALAGQGIGGEDHRAMRRILEEEWNLEKSQAALLCKVTAERSQRGLDHFRLTRSFFECTTHDERRDFLFQLFRMANSVEQTSFEEIEIIRRIARSLKLSHDDFIQAKLSIDPDDRSGL